MMKFEEEKLHEKPIEKSEEPNKPLEKEKSFEFENKNINIKFLFSAHATETDTRYLENELKNADIFLPELSQWSFLSSYMFQSVADGKINPEKLAIKNPFEQSRLNALYNKKVKVIFIDTPVLKSVKDAKEKEQIQKMILFKLTSTEMKNNTVTNWENGQFEKAIKFWKESTKKFTEYSKLREEYIINKLKESLKDIVKEPKYKDKKSINIVAQFGAAHTGLHHETKKIYPPTFQRKLNEKMEGDELFGKDGGIKSVKSEKKLFPKSSLYMYDAQGQLCRAYLLGKGETDDKLAAQGFLTDILRGSIYKFTDDSYTVSRVLRQLISPLSLNDLRTICESKRAWLKKFHEIFEDIKQQEIDNQKEKIEQLTNEGANQEKLNKEKIKLNKLIEKKRKMVIPSTMKNFDALVEYIREEDERKYGRVSV